MTDRNIRIFLVFSIIVLAISFIERPRALPPVPVSDNGIVPPEILQPVAAEDAILDRPVEGLALDDCQLDAAIEFLAAASKTTIYANWDALAKAQIERTIWIHIHSHRGTLGEMLTLVADNARWQGVRPAYEVEGEAIAFSTPEDMLAGAVTEVFNLRPLIREIDSWTPPTVPGPGVMIPEDDVDRITKVITDTVAPESWRDSGGTDGGIHEAGGLLIVTQTRANQREIATLLTRLDAEMRK